MKSIILSFIGVLAILGAIFAAAFFFGGFFNVAASEDDPDIVNWAIEHVRAASIARHATVLPTGSLDDPTLVQAGAKAFSTRGCVHCHGGPGVEWSKFSEGLNPGPPDLKDVVDDPAEEIFWVIKNGIKMTGMPSFGKIEVPDQEIWSIVAFVKKLKTVSEEDYKAWTAAAPAAKP
jgi:mono/diheme cytochrome c family protein